jgi:outer membrane receptor for ferrienterochelin and colicins
MNHQYKSYMTGIILAAMAMPAYAAAADTAQADTQNLLNKDVVVTATRTEAEIKTVPNTVEVITADPEAGGYRCLLGTAAGR